MYYHNATYQEDLRHALLSTSSLEKLSECRVLVTGATGLIGSFLVDALMLCDDMCGLHAEVYAMSRDLGSLQARFKSHVTSSYFHPVEHDVTSPLPFSHGFDYVIHAASNAYPRAFVTDPVGTIVTNILGTYNLLEHGRKTGMRRLLFVSSGEVYGQGLEGVDSFEESYSGYVDSTNPRSCYPNSKRVAESLCVSYTFQYGIDTIIARPCHVYGPTVTPKDDRASAQFLYSVVMGNDIVMKSEGSQVRSYCYVADCCSALLAILIAGKGGHAYNIANPDSCISIREMAEIIASISGRRIMSETPSETEKSGYNPATRSVLSADKLQRLGWRASYDMKTGLERTIEIMRWTPLSRQ